VCVCVCVCGVCVCVCVRLCVCFHAVHCLLNSAIWKHQFSMLEEIQLGDIPVVTYISNKRQTTHIS
jgi:hypothetical protein